MKRIVCLILCFVIAFLVLSPVLADTSSYEYPPVIFYLSTKSQLEKEFREFVKKLSREYYYGNYDLNKYYYEAATVKHEWDNGGFMGSRKDNPFSTIEDNPYYKDYNLPVIQQMLLNGLVEKSDTIKRLGVREYSPNLSINPVTGDWEVDGKAVIAQQRYDAEVERAVAQAQTQLEMTLLNSSVDLVVVGATGGNTPGAYANFWDALTNIAADGVNAYIEAEYVNRSAVLQNQYYDMMVQSTLNFYDKIEEALLADTRNMQIELLGKATTLELTEYEKTLKEQLQKILDSVDKMQDVSLSSQDEEELKKIAEDIVNESGLKKEEELEPDEIAAYVFLQIVRSATVNVIDAVIKTANPGLSFGHTVLKDIILDTVDISLEKLIDYAILYDFDGDGLCSASELCECAIDFLLQGNLITDTLNNIFTNSAEKMINKDLYENLNKAIANRDKAVKVYKDLKNAYYTKSRPWKNKTPDPKTGVELGKLKKSMNRAENSANEAKRGVKKAQDKLDEKIDMNSFTGVGIFVEDIIHVVTDTLVYVKETTGLDDTRDSEVTFAYYAASIYHTMEVAEMRRKSMYGVYKSLQFPENIDKEDIKLLKAFVNRIFAIYETDLQGHTDYITLDLNWHYQDEQRYQEVMDNYYNYFLPKHKEEHPFISFFSGPVTKWSFEKYGKEKSEYLEEVNKKKDNGGYGWIDEDTAYDVYDQIVEYAETAIIPDRLKAVGK